MTTAPPPACERFFNNLMAMKDPVIDIVRKFGDEKSLIKPELLDAAFNFLSMICGHQDLMDTFIARTHPHWEFIASTEDPNLMLRNVLDCFKELGEDKIQEVLDLVKDKQIPPETQKQLLTLGKSLVKISIKYLRETNSTLVDTEYLGKLYNLKF